MVTIKFNHRLCGMTFNNGNQTFRGTDEEILLKIAVFMEKEDRYIC